MFELHAWLKQLRLYKLIKLLILLGIELVFGVYLSTRCMNTKHALLGSAQLVARCTTGPRRADNNASRQTIMLDRRNAPLGFAEL